MKPVHFVHLALLGVLWGSSYLFIKVALDGVDPVTLVEGRLVIGAIFLIGMLRLRRLGMVRGIRAWAHILVMAIVGIIIPQVLIAWSEQHVSSSLAAILSATTPFFTLLFAAGVFQTEGFTPGKALGLLVGFSGVAVLTGADLANLASSSAQGQIALIGSSIGYGAAFAYARRFLRGEPLTLAGSQMLTAALLLAPGVLIFGDPGAMDLNPTILLAWVALGSLSSGVAYILYYQLIGAVGATVASFGTYLIPIVGVFWGWLLLGEHVGPATFLGVTLIFAGLAIATRQQWARGRTRATPPAIPAETAQPEAVVRD